jgi:hypothetical protein
MYCMRLGGSHVSLSTAATTARAPVICTMSGTPVGLGAGGPVWQSLLKTGHILVGGERGSGKSTWLNNAANAKPCATACECTRHWATQGTPMLLSLRNFGPKALEALKAKLVEHGFLTIEGKPADGEANKLGRGVTH